MPFDIVSYVMGLNAGKGSGGKDDDKQFNYYSGSFKATEAQMTVEHNCGQIPNIVVVYGTEKPELNTIFFAVGANKAMIDKTEGLKSLALYLSSNGGAYGLTDDNGIENPADWPSYANAGGIREATATSFVVGGTQGGLLIDATYDWFAICGIA